VSEIWVSRNSVMQYSFRPDHTFCRRQNRDEFPYHPAQPSSSATGAAQRAGR
jgi:hypothetical protein